MTLTQAIRLEYQRLYTSCQLRPERSTEVHRICDRIVKHAARYRDVADRVGAPWFLVGVIHSLESSLSFATHLHNGDALTDYTVHVPRGRPLMGSPPFRWEDSAIDALVMQRWDRWRDWSLTGCCYRIEAYNGFGYRKRGVRSPYLWAGSHHEQPGRYVADGVWDASAISKQIGAAVLMHTMESRGEVRWLTGDEVQ